MDSPDEDRRKARRLAERERRKRRTRNQRLTISIAIPVAAIALFVGLELGAPGADDTSSANGPDGAEVRRAAERRHKKEDAAIDRVLEYTGFVTEGGGRKRLVALTFDDGPGEYTHRIMRILKRTGTPATFFPVGSLIPGHEKTIRRIERDGHSIGNHTQDHPRMGELASVEQTSQLSGQAARIEAAGAREQRLFRPPYRSFNETTMELLGEHSLLMVLWSVDTADYVGLGSKAVARRALDEAKPGSIILMHDGGGDRTDTVRALPDIIKGLKRRKLKPVTVPRLMLEDPPAADQPLPERLSGS